LSSGWDGSPTTIHPTRPKRAANGGAEPLLSTQAKIAGSIPARPIRRQALAEIVSPKADLRCDATVGELPLDQNLDGVVHGHDLDESSHSYSSRADMNPHQTKRDSSGIAVSDVPALPNLEGRSELAEA
jgi:hypothetical protein